MKKDHEKQTLLLEDEQFIGRFFEHLIDKDTFTPKSQFAQQLMEFITILSENIICLLDKDFNFSFISKSFLDKTGYDFDFYLRYGVKKILSKASFLLIKDLKRVVLSGKVIAFDELLKFDFEVIKSNNEKFWAEITLHPFYKDSKYIGTIGFVRDIDKRKRSEIDLLYSKNKYLTFFESAPVGLWECDISLIVVYLNSLRLAIDYDIEEYFVRNPQEVQNCLNLLTVNEVNHIALSSYGVQTIDEFKQMITQTAYSNSFSFVVSMLKSFYQHSLTYENETTHLKKNKEKIDVKYKWSVVPGCEDLFQRVIFSMIDVTEENKTKLEILKSKVELQNANSKLEELFKTEKALAYEANLANDAKNRFLSTMSHEIRTPINGIVGLTQLLQNTTLTSEQKEYTDLLLDSSSRLVTIVDRIFDYSKITDHEDKNLISFSLYEVIVSCVKTVAYRAYENNVEVFIMWNYACPDLVEGDPNSFKQILLYFIDNAIKFTKHGFISVSLEQAIEQNEDMFCFHFAVNDTGIGFDQSYVKDIFEPFYQIDSSENREFEGAGLGLALATQMIRVRKGSISCQSELGKGSKFSIMLPFKVPFKKHILQLTKPNNQKIIACVDSKEFREIFSNFFHNVGLQVSFASCQSLETEIQNNNYDYMIVSMNNAVDVFTVIDRNKEMIQKNKQKLIMMYRTFDTFDMDRYINLPIYERIALPVDMVELYNIINREKR